MPLEQALRAQKQNTAHEHERSDPGDRRIRNALDDALKEGEQHRSGGRAGQIAKPADDHRHEADRENVDATAKVDRGDWRRDCSTERGERKSDAESQHIDAFCRKTPRDRTVATERLFPAMRDAFAVSRSCRTARIQVPMVVCCRNRKKATSAAIERAAAKMREMSYSMTDSGNVTVTC